MATYSYATLREVRVNIADRTAPYYWDDEDLGLFLDRASGNLNGASAYALQARAVEEATAWASVNVGGLSRDKQNAVDNLMKLAQQYADQSGGTAVLDDTAAPAFGVARIDWQEHATDRLLPNVVDAAARRIRAEKLEG